MAKGKQYKIKWRESDVNELKRVVRNFNAKIRRVEKKAVVREKELRGQGTGVVIPEKVSVKQLTDLIKTRKDLNRELNRMERFLKRGSEEFVSVPNNNLEITKWQRTEMNRMFRTSKKRSQEKLDQFKEMTATQQGKKAPYSVAQQLEFVGMGKALELEIKGLSKAFLPNKSATEVNRRFANLQRKVQSTYYTDRDYAVKYNYLQGIYENYNMADPRVQEIVRIIEETPIDKFMEIFYKEGGSAAFDIPSPPGWKKGKSSSEQNLAINLKEGEYDTYLQALANTWVFRED